MALWEDLSDDGRDIFVRGLMEAASRPLDDRVQAVAEVIDSWQTAWSLLYAPLDDEPFSPEEAAAADAAIGRPPAGDVRRLEGRSAQWRLRVGDWR